MSNFRWITPMLLTANIFILTLILNKVDKMDTHFTNHLMHHQDLEVGYERRLTCVEKQVEVNTQRWNLLINGKTAK